MSGARGLARPARLAARRSGPFARRLPEGRASASRLLSGFRGKSSAVIVDGGKVPDDVVAEMARASGQHERPLDVLAVGQRGTMAALSALAQLRQESQSPTFTVSKIEQEDIIAQARPGFRVDGHNNYRLNVPEASLWEKVPGERVASRLMVGNQTEVMPLAKAIAARVKEVPEGGSISVETTVGGRDERRLLRVSRLVHAVARALHWQVSPVDATRPTRPFRCAASLVGDQAPAAADGQGTVSPVLRVEVVPSGPVGGVALSVPAE
ncbi:unnamed protein product [Prorocentrum cordatum]|uniref:Uncharacterized protein n=1 Tax=Prorocentrum cordatum TaxID=2364126 RepID=A0ABN9UN22_9DINO|nr:unnamed protein product [Polarella glacialis]